MHVCVCVRACVNKTEKEREKGTTAHDARGRYSYINIYIHIYIHIYIYYIIIRQTVVGKPLHIYRSCYGRLEGCSRANLGGERDDTKKSHPHTEERAKFVVPLARISMCLTSSRISFAIIIASSTTRIDPEIVGI